MLMSLKPVAAQVGRASEHTVTSRYNLYGAYQVLVSGTGVTAEVVPLPKPKDGKTPSLTSLKLKFTIAKDALPGVRDFRIATPQGVSTLGQLVIVRDPVVVEKGVLNPVTVVGVNVHVSNSLAPGQQQLDGQRGVVEDAEPRGLPCRRVM